MHDSAWTGCEASEPEARTATVRGGNSVLRALARRHLFNKDGHGTGELPSCRNRTAEPSPARCQRPERDHPKAGEQKTSNLARGSRKMGYR